MLFFVVRLIIDFVVMANSEAKKGEHGDVDETRTSQAKPRVDLATLAAQASPYFHSRVI